MKIIGTVEADRSRAADHELGGSRKASIETTYCHLEAVLIERGVRVKNPKIELLWFKEVDLVAACVLGRHSLCI